MNPGVELALELGFHLMTRDKMSAKCRGMLEACPKVDFAGLEVGKTYASPKNGGYIGFTVEHVTPAKRAADVRRAGSSSLRIYRGDWPGPFSELTPNLIKLQNTTHDNVVWQAAQEKRDVPAAVRREYPGLFVEVPERFAMPNKSADERVKNALGGQWESRAATAALIDGWIAESHDSIKRLMEERTRAVVANAALAQDYDEYIQDHKGNIDFYRWLRPLVDVGGVFYLDEMK